MSLRLVECLERELVGRLDHLFRSSLEVHRSLWFVGHAQRFGVQAGGFAQMRPLEMMIKECLAPKIVMARLIWCDNWGRRAEAKQQDKTEKTGHSWR